MAIRVPRLVHANRILEKSSADVPKGHLAVYVGERQKKRYVIPLSYLSQPLFQDLLSQAEQEFGFDHPIPCPEDAFIDLTLCLSRNQ